MRKYGILCSLVWCGKVPVKVTLHPDRMKAPSVSLHLDLAVLLVSGLTISAISLNVSPNRQQFFTRESVSLTCGEEESSDGWTLKRISVVKTEKCGAAQGFGRRNGSSCIVSDLSPLSDRGVYWCEHRSGQRSIKVTITVSDRPFIMEIPALPVIAGSDVTLRCRSRNGSTIPVNFFKYGRHSTPIGAAPEGEFTIRNVQQSDEGFYWCSTGQTESPSSKLNVRAPPPPPTNSPSLISTLIRVLCHLVVIILYCICTCLMMSTCCCRKKGKTPTVTMEMTQCIESGQGLPNICVDDTADVTTEHDF
ncbi:roundabout homolog 1-like [Micropterus salmoides]|uniref:roundabout homolog 1-like n=1 Tax=Micropterus salmoides TaxID=27706 RepID=UPI0018EBC729|nr:roundabout homolog 1-like [Micropterus salmoides]